MDFLAGLIVGSTGWLLFYALIIMALFVEHNERHGWTVILVALTTCVSKSLFDLDWSTLGYAVVVYIPLGFVWSFWRWKRYLKKVVAAFDPKTITSRPTV